MTELEPSRPTPREWARFAVVTGLLATSSYFFSVVLHVLPQGASRLLFFAIGPLAVMSTLAFYRALEHECPSISLGVGALLNVIGGVLVNVMAVVQATQFTVLVPQLQQATDETSREIASRVLWGVNVVQAGLDVSWDIFVSLGTVFLGVALLGHPRYGRLYGGIGIVVAAAALGLNLATFPTAPSEAGLVDLGPGVGLWYVLVLVQLVRPLRAPRPGAA